MSDRAGMPDFTGALCAKADPTDNPWQPNDHGASKQRRQKTEYAKQICAECPQLEPCRTWAVNRPDEIGIWGGTTELERVEIRMGRNPADRQEIAHGTESGYDAERRRGMDTCAECRDAVNKARQARAARRKQAA